jgi:hypothetical protein
VVLALSSEEAPGPVEGCLHPAGDWVHLGADGCMHTQDCRRCWDPFCIL